LETPINEQALPFVDPYYSLPDTSFSLDASAVYKHNRFDSTIFGNPGFALRQVFDAHVG
jgi:hypothetical protein